MCEKSLQTLMESTDMPAESFSKVTYHTTELKLDHWGLRQGEALLHESKKLQQLALNEAEVADLIGLAFLPSIEFHELSQDPVRRKFMEQLVQNADFLVLKDSTRLNLVASQIAATAFGKELCGLKQTVETPPLKPTELKTNRMALISGTARAARAATKDVSDFTQACEAFGLGPGKPGDLLEAKLLAQLFQQFQSNPIIQRISKLAGCYRKVAEGCHTLMGRDGLDIFSGINQGSELSRVLPSELLRIAIPELETDFLRRFAEGQLLVRDFDSTDPAGLGPVVIVVDESGSMNGAKIENAKAMALVFAWIAKCQGRWCGLVSFSGSSGHSVLALPPGAIKTEEMLNWAIGFIGGGSDQDLPVGDMPAIFTEIGAPVGKTDLVYVSDALLQIKEQEVRDFRVWKASVKARLISLVIGTYPGDLATISDKVHIFKMLNPDSVRDEQVFVI